jgi:hypothetical protein
MTMLIKIDENGNPTEKYPITHENFYYLVPALDRKILTSSDVLPYGYGIFEFTQAPQELSLYKKAIETYPIKGNRDNGDVVYWQNWEIVDKTEKEMAELIARATVHARNFRDFVLTKTDFWELPSQAPISQEKLNFRQAMRDVPSQEGFPLEVNWPNDDPAYQEILSGILIPPFKLG